MTPVYAYWLPSDNSLSEYEKWIATLKSLTGMEANELKKLISKRCESSSLSHVEMATYLNNYYLKYGKMPSDN